MEWFNKTIKGLGVIFAVLAGSLVFPVLAQETSKSITISRDCKVGDQKLEKGSYTIKFDDDKGGDLQFLHGKKDILKAAYQITKLKAPAPSTAVIFTVADDGSYEVKRIEFQGKEFALALKQD
ncbi:MAG TPA: hypothetical protein VJX67_17165 [Blastocatellia bacterium]|nr:hypothetical protein [Blastocatellia bacterium]